MASSAVLTLNNNTCTSNLFENFTFKTKAHETLCICWAHIHLLVHTNKVWWTLEVLWTDFHLRPLNRFMIVFPVIPHHSRVVIFAVHVKAIKVWVIAILVPPTALTMGGTVDWGGGVIISIFSGERWATMIAERITSRAWKKEFQWEFYDNVPKRVKDLLRCFFIKKHFE